MGKQIPSITLLRLPTSFKKMKSGSAEFRDIHSPALIQASPASVRHHVYEELKKPMLDIIIAESDVL